MLPPATQQHLSNWKPQLQFHVQTEGSLHLAKSPPAMWRIFSHSLFLHGQTRNSVSASHKEHEESHFEELRGKTAGEQNSPGLCQCCYGYTSHCTYKVSTEKITNKDGSKLPSQVYNTAFSSWKRDILLQAFRNHTLPTTARSTESATQLQPHQNKGCIAQKVIRYPFRLPTIIRINSGVIEIESFLIT